MGKVLEQKLLYCIQKVIEQKVEQGCKKSMKGVYGSRKVEIQLNQGQTDIKTCKAQTLQLIT